MLETTGGHLATPSQPFGRRGSLNVELMRGGIPEEGVTALIKNDANAVLAKPKTGNLMDAANLGEQKLMSKSFSNLAQASNEVLDKTATVRNLFIV